MATLPGGFNLGQNQGASTQALSLINTPAGSRLRVHTDARIDTIAARAIEGLNGLKKLLMNLSFRWVAVDLGGAQGSPTQQVMVNIRSLANRAGLTTGQARQLLKSENGLQRLSHLTQGLVSSLKKPTSAPDGYSRYSDNVSSLFRRVGSLAAPLLIAGKDPELRSGVAHNDNWCLVIKKEGRKIALYDTANRADRKALGEGSFGKVIPTQDLVSEKESGVLKIAHRRDDTSVEEEAAILDILNPRGQVPGLQLPPMKVTHFIEEEEGDSRPAYLAIRYDSDLCGKKVLAGADIKQALYQLTTGLLHMHDNGWFHGDIKPENMLTKSSRAHPNRFDIADLGGAKTLEKKLELFVSGIRGEPGITPGEAKGKAWGVYTPLYVMKSDKRDLNASLDQYQMDFYRTGDPEISDELKKHLTLLMQARDAYALGSSFAEMLLGRHLELKDLNSELNRVQATLQSPSNNMPAAEAQEIVGCLRGMMGLVQPSLRVSYETRILAMHRLNQLMGASLAPVGGAGSRSASLVPRPPLAPPPIPHRKIAAPRDLPGAVPDLTPRLAPQSPPQVLVQKRIPKGPQAW